MLSFDEFILNEDENPGHPEMTSTQHPISPVLRRSLDKVGKNLKSNQDIINRIKEFGFEEIRPVKKSNAVDHIFKDPYKEMACLYKSYTNGTVRTHEAGMGMFTRGSVNIGRMTRSYLPDERDRLLLILRFAIKSALGQYPGFYKQFMDGSLDLDQFLHQKRGTIKGKEFGF
jgi:hypothetical protein